MAKTQTIEVDPELVDQFRKSAEQRDRFILGVLQSHKHELSDRKKSALKGQSLFGFMAEIWKTLTTGEKESWRTAGAESNLSNWQLFISDNAIRLKNELPLDQPPNDIWQVRTGYLKLEGSATEIKLVQLHPLDYWVVRKIRGQPWKKELVKVTEPIQLPIDLQISYESDLSVDGAEQIAKYSVQVWHSYQGVDYITEYAIDFDAVASWKVDTISTDSSLLGHVVGYYLVLHIKGYTGTVLFDNIKATHTSQNWARDPRADNISKIFTKAFAVARPFWEPEILPTGASYNTVFPPAL